MGPLAFRLMVLEAAVFSATVCATSLAWSRPIGIDWIETLAVVGRGLAVSVSCTAAFYDNEVEKMRFKHLTVKTVLFGRGAQAADAYPSTVAAGASR